MIPGALPWHAEAWARVHEQIAADRLPHALLVCSTPGSGGDRFASRLAASWLCSHGEPESRPCGSCHSCHMFEEKAHMDCLQLQPEAAGKVIPVDEVRRIGRFASQSSMRSAASVVWIEPAEAMNLYAANALLKTLEEPREGVYLILSTTAPGRLLPTVRSRCQSLVLAPPTPGQSRAFLAEHVADAQQVDALMAVSDCAPLLALSYHENDLLQAQQVFAGAMDQLEEGNAAAIEAVAAGAALPLPTLLDTLYGRLLRRLAAHTDGRRRRQAARCYDQLVAARRAMFSASNPNRELMLESLLIEWPGVGAARDR